jgi:transcriptional regulator with XRE-family HTH domain
LRRRRVQLGWPKTRLAEAAGITPRYVAGLEREACTPSIEVLHRLAAALDCPVTDLMQDPESDPVTAGTAA